MVKWSWIVITILPIMAILGIATDHLLWSLGLILAMLVIPIAEYHSKSKIGKRARAKAIRIKNLAPPD
jgi:predicted membrane protein